MEIVICPEAGVCFGVKRALEMAEECIQSGERPVYSYGPLIHNPRVVRELGSRGLEVLEDLTGVAEGTVILRCHGVPPQEIAAAKARGLNIVDTTCPNVKKAQDLAVELVEDGYSLIVIGEKDHAEIKAITAAVEGKVIVIESIDEVEKIPFMQKIGIISQTTQSEGHFNRIAAALLNKGKEFKIHKTICQATEERQKSTLEIARQVDAIIVLGGKNSANTKRLSALCRETGIPTFDIEDPAEIEKIDLSSYARIGITAGASTPGSQIEELAGKIRAMNSDQPREPELFVPAAQDETIAEEELRPVEPAPQPADEAEDMVELLKSSYKPYETGQRLTATIVHVRPESIYVSLGGKSDFEIPRAETNFEDDISLDQVYKVGDEIEVIVKGSGDGETFKLSCKPIQEEKKWEELAQMSQQGQILTGKVKQEVKGGLLVDIDGIEAFLPASQVSLNRVDNLESFITQTVEVKILEIDQRRRRMVVSRRAVLEEQKRKEAESFWAELNEGDVVTGTVTNLMDFGAFIQLKPGVEGLLHISEIAWDKVKHPSEKLAVGDELQVAVKSLDREKKRISLSLKQILEDPWQKAAESFPEGGIFKGVVSGMTGYGAFVKMAEGIEGLVHLSEIDDKFVKKPEDVLQMGQEVEVMVTKNEPQLRRLSLSIKKAKQEKEAKEAEDYMAQQQTEDEKKEPDAPESKVESETGA